MPISETHFLALAFRQRLRRGIVALGGDQDEGTDSVPAAVKASLQ